MLIATWNLEWARSCARVDAARCQLDAIRPDVIVFTEIDARPFDHGYWIDAGGDWGYGVQTTRRKVAMWSRQPWRSVERIAARATPGRLIVATTAVEAVNLTVIGVCIPWRDAHVRTGPIRHGEVWRDHLEFCSVLRPIIANRARTETCVLAGDWNQRIPRRGQPQPVADALTVAIAPLQVHTAGDTEVGQLIDHIATTPDLSAKQATVWSGTLAGVRVSDHAGVAVELESTSTTKDS